MASKKTLREYLDDILACDESDRLRDEFKIDDNWPILLYGNEDGLFSKIVRAFREAPQEDGLRGKWTQQGCYHNDPYYAYFEYDAGAVVVQVRKCPDRMQLDEEDRINGLDHVMFVMFHPYQKKSMEGRNHRQAMAFVIAEFGEYIIQQKLTARLPYHGLDINHVPT